MALQRGYRFPVSQAEAFPMGLLLNGQIEAAIKYNPDRNAMPEQLRDYNPKTNEGTGLLMWKANVTDPHEPKAKRKSFELIFLAENVPAVTGEELAPGTGLRMLQVEGLMAEPKVMGQGEFKYLGYQYFAGAIKGDNSGARNRPVAEKAA